VYKSSSVAPLAHYGRSDSSDKAAGQTKVDGIIDLVFLTAEEVSFSETTMPTIDENGKGPVVDQLDFGIGATASETSKVDTGDLSVLDKRQQAIFHEQCVKRASAKLQADLIKISRSVYRTPDGNIALSCTISREYAQKNRIWYWFAFHPCRFVRKTCSNPSVSLIHVQDLVAPNRAMNGHRPNLLPFSDAVLIDRERGLADFRFPNRTDLARRVAAPTATACEAAIRWYGLNHSSGGPLGCFGECLYGLSERSV